MVRIMAGRTKAVTVGHMAFEITCHPGERPFENPSFGQDLKAGSIGSLDDFPESTPMVCIHRVSQ
jgi:hypothetical protein